MEEQPNGPGRQPVTRVAARLLADRWFAIWHGWRDGRAGMSVEDAADAPFLCRLRAQVTARIDTERERLDHQLDALDPLIISLTRDLDRHLARRRAMVTRSRARTLGHELHYRLIAALYGASFVRHHRHRSWVRLGWRTPPLPALHGERRDPHRSEEE